MANVRVVDLRHSTPLGHILRAAREDKGLTTGQLARMIDPKLRHRYIQTIENGSVDPTTHMLEKIVAALDRA